MIKENKIEETARRKQHEIKKGGVRNCRLSLWDMNRVLIDPETEAIIRAQWTQQHYRARGRGGGRWSSGEKLEDAGSESCSETRTFRGPQDHLYCGIAKLFELGDKGVGRVVCLLIFIDFFYVWYLYKNSVNCPASHFTHNQLLHVCFPVLLTASKIAGQNVTTLVLT